MDWTDDYKKLTELDQRFEFIIKTYGYPENDDKENNFESLVQIILGQQVSTSSAKSHFNRLKQKLKKITPVSVLKLSDSELRACFISRQKGAYIRNLASELEGSLDLNDLAKNSDDDIRKRLKKIKGIGNWTCNIYLMFCLYRPDILPIGDLVIRKVILDLWDINTLEEGNSIAKTWRPYRTAASHLLWHFNSFK